MDIHITATGERGKLSTSDSFGCRVIALLFAAQPITQTIQGDIDRAVILKLSPLQRAHNLGQFCFSCAKNFCGLRKRAISLTIDLNSWFHNPTRPFAVSDSVVVVTCSVHAAASAPPFSAM